MKKNICIFVNLIAFAYSMFAQKALSVSEFAALNIDSEKEIKIIDVLNENNQSAIISACSKLKCPIDLDLSDCTFDMCDADIDFFHIRNVKTCILPKGTKSIINFDCEDLRQIILPSGLKTISKQAFFESGLTSIDIPNSVEYVGACAFGDCDSLKYIRTNDNKNIHKWSKAWYQWNDAAILTTEDFQPTENKVEENPNKIAFDHKVYYLIGGQMNIKITLSDPLLKTQKVKLCFYDAHNNNSEQGFIELKIKKNNKEIEVKNVPAEKIGISDSDLFHLVFDECEDYWVKVQCALEFEDGTKMPLDGSTRLYFVGLPFI